MSRARVVFAVLAVLTIACAAMAQSECDLGECSYDFSVEGKGFQDWEPFRCPVSGCNNYVVNGQGVMNVLNDPANPVPHHWSGLRSHLRWSTVGHGFRSATVSFGFTGDNGHAGWVRKLTDNSSLCQALTHAPRASDEMLILTILDTGGEWLGVYWAGDELPLGNGVRPRTHTINNQRAITGFSVAGIVQKSSTADARVLSRVYLPEVVMGDKSLRMSIEARQDIGGYWWARAIGTRGVSLRFDTEVPLSAEPPDVGTVGLIAVINPAPWWCIYMEGGMFDRQFTVHDRLVAWK